MTRLNNKSILITGGSSGLGAAAAILMAKDGAKIAIAARRRAQGEEVVRQIEAAGGEAIFIEADVTQSTDVQRMVAEAVQRYGRIDCAVNNAGVATPFVAVADIEEDDWNHTIGINLTGVWLCMKYEIRAMLKSGGGSIVNISSIYGQKPSDIGDSAYSASKHGVIGLSGSAAIDYAKDGIRVNSVCPGFCHSEMVDPPFEAQPKLAAAILNRHSATQRLGEAEEAAEVMAWLCSDASGFVSGAAVAVDGGTTARLY